MKVSVVIPTLNAGSQFRDLLEKISRQEGDFEVETLIVDSGSTDGTVELAREYGAKVHRIPKSEFNHGATRNLGISLSTGDFVALVVQDAIPLDERWLATMVENLDRDDLVAGVYGRQLPHLHAGAMTRVLVGNLASASLERRDHEIPDLDAYEKLPPPKRRRLAAFDNVSSCLRRSVWEEMPFDATNFGEDMRWAKKALEAGYKTVYEPRSAVFHSHERGAVYDLRRYYMDQRLVFELFGLARAPSLARLLMTIPGATIHMYRMLRRDAEMSKKGAPLLVLLSLKHAVPAQIGSYLGARSRTLARISPRAFEKMHRLLSKGV